MKMALERKKKPQPMRMGRELESSFKHPIIQIAGSIIDADKMLMIEIESLQMIEIAIILNI
jgi:hypothetical protein